MRVAVTGPHGFLGWHTRVRLHAANDYEVIPVGRSDWNRLPEIMMSADAVIHLAGVNRASDSVVMEENLRLARDVAEASRASGQRPTIVFANSTQRDAETVYGQAKRTAAEILAKAAADVGSGFVDVVLPNLFGEHGRPDYNSFVATFANMIVNGEEPHVKNRQIELVHAQSAAQALIDGVTLTEHRCVRPEGTISTVEQVLATLRAQFDVYRTGDIPPLLGRFDVELFNTLRSFMFPAIYPMQLVLRTDRRGSLVEAVRAHGSKGQTFISTTKPTITRGQHFHLRKVERFVVVGGQARIALRRVLSDERATFDVAGDVPVVVDMPTMWTHNITNIGRGELTTMFWTNELFDPEDSDTYPEDV